MKVCIVGTGAVGGLLAAGLAGREHELTLVDRGARLRALREAGLTVRGPEGAQRRIRDFAAVPLDEAGTQDLVVLAVKSHQIGAVAPALPELFHDRTTVLTVQNGIPWWYFEGRPGPHAGRRLAALDPSGTIAAHLEPGRIVAGIVYAAARLDASGAVEHVEGDRVPVGELDDSDTPRVRRVAATLEDAGFRSRVLDDLRGEIWLKALGSASFNPISALTGATMAGICRHAETRALARAAMEEAWAVAAALGVTPRRSIDRRMEGAERVGEHKTSMLQDVEAGEPLEHEALLGAVCELGRLTGVPTPRLDALYALTAALDARLRAARGEEPASALAAGG